MFGDTANSGTVLGENPIRANYIGASIFGPGTKTAMMWFNPSAFATPAAYTFGKRGQKLRAWSGTSDGGSIAPETVRGERTGCVPDSRGILQRAESHHLDIPNRFVNTPQFGTITAVATPGREIQISTRISF